MEASATAVEVGSSCSIPALSYFKKPKEKGILQKRNTRVVCHHEDVCFCKKGQGRSWRRGGENEEEIFKRMAEFRKLFSLEDEVVGDKEQEALEIFMACAAMVSLI